MNLDDLYRKLRGSNPYPTEVADDPEGERLRDLVRARIEAGRRPEARQPRGRGIVVAAAAAIAVIVAGVGAVVFLGGDGSVPVATQPTTTTSAPPPTTVTSVPPTTPTTAPPTTSGPPSCTEAAPDLSSGDVLAFFATCAAGSEPPYPVYRATDDDRTELQLLILGTTEAERARDLSTGWDFVPERERIDVVVDRDPDDVITLEFTIDGEVWTPGPLASASAQLLSFLEPLQATLFATDPEIAAIDLSNLCWGEMGCGPAGSNISTRADWEGGLFVNYGVITAPGCDLETYYQVDHCSVDAVDATEYPVTVINVADDDTLNVRSGPGVEYFRVGEVEPGATLAALWMKAQAADGAMWQLVRLGDGTAGWVNSAYIVPTEQLGNRSAEEQLVDALVAFAKQSGDDAFDALPLADIVDLGIGGDLFETHAAADLRSVDTWIVEAVPDFDGLVGPFSALEVLGTADRYTVTSGEHPRCAGPARDYPEAVTALDQISVQPVLGPQSSCLQWYSVDLFVDAAGDIAAVFLDLWGP